MYNFHIKRGVNTSAFLSKAIIIADFKHVTLFSQPKSQSETCFCLSRFFLVKQQNFTKTGGGGIPAGSPFAGRRPLSSRGYFSGCTCWKQQAAEPSAVTETVSLHPINHGGRTTFLLPPHPQQFSSFLHRPTDRARTFRRLPAFTFV